MAGTAIGLVLLGAAICEGQGVAIQPREKAADKSEGSPRPTLRVESSLVLVPVSVSDSMGRNVTGLEKENFRVFDNKVEQKIVQFAMDDEPVAVGFVFDTSGSMGNKLALSREAVREFVKTGNPEDEFCLVKFDSAPKLVVPLTRDAEEIENQLFFTQSRGTTALLDAVLLVLQELKKSSKNKKAVLVISDGGENNSRYSQSEVKNRLLESDALIYCIGVFGGGRSPEEAAGPWLLRQIAEETGGRLYPAEGLASTAHAISLELRHRYLLAYSPNNLQRDGRYHRLEVKMITPRGLKPLHAHWREGYFAPAE